MAYLENINLKVGNEEIKGIAHNDLKPENIFIDGDSIKLGDFGTWKNIASKAANQINGTIQYLPLELLKSTESVAVYDQEKADVWAAGVILFEILYGHYPFKGDVRCVTDIINIIETKKYHRIGNLPKSSCEVSSELKSLVCSMLNPDPQMRPCWSDVKSNRRISYV